MNSNVIRIVNLGDNTTEQSLRQFIQQYISLQNIIVNIFVNKDVELGLVFAYVVFQNTADAVISVNKLDGFYFNYNVLEVELIGPTLKCKNYRQENINPKKIDEDLQQKIKRPILNHLSGWFSAENNFVQNPIRVPPSNVTPSQYSNIQNKREPRFNQNLQQKTEIKKPRPNQFGGWLGQENINPKKIDEDLQQKIKRPIPNHLSGWFPEENNFVQNPIRVPPSNVTPSQYSNIQNKREPRFNQNLQQKTEIKKPRPNQFGGWSGQENINTKKIDEDLQQKINRPIPNHLSGWFPAENNFVQNPIRVPPSNVTPSQYSNIQNKREPRFNQNLQQKTEIKRPRPNQVGGWSGQENINPKKIDEDLQQKIKRPIPNHLSGWFPAENNFVQSPIRVTPSNVRPRQNSNIQNKTESRFNQKTETPRPNTIERKPSAVTNNQFKLPAKNNFVQNPIRVPSSNVTPSQYSNLQNKTEPRFNQNLQQKIETPRPNQIDRKQSAVTNSQFRLQTGSQLSIGEERATSSNFGIHKATQPPKSKPSCVVS